MAGGYRFCRRCLTVTALGCLHRLGLMGMVTDHKVGTGVDHLAPEALLEAGRAAGVLDAPMWVDDHDSGTGGARSLDVGAEVGRFQRGAADRRFGRAVVPG